MEQRVCQGIVEDAAAICGALLTELRLRGDLLANEDSSKELLQAAVGGTLASRKPRKEDTARALRELVERGLLSDGPGIERTVHLARCPDEVAQALDLANDEPGTTTWFALRFGPGSFAIFDAFESSDEREDHLGGKVAAALMARANELFSNKVVIEKLDVLAAKLP